MRNRLKIRSAVANAQAALKVQAESGSMAGYLWGLAGGTAKQNAWKGLSDLPAITPDSERISKELVKRGFRFVGPTGVYAFMQSCGMVNDHIVSCFRHREVKAMSARR